MRNRLKTMYEDSICPDCGEECQVIPDDNSFSYAGTHCTYGRGGVHYPPGFGNPVSACCCAQIENAEAIEPDYDY